MHACTTKSYLKTTTNSLCVWAHLENKADSDSDMKGASHISTYLTGYQPYEVKFNPPNHSVVKCFNTMY